MKESNMIYFLLQLLIFGQVYSQSEVSCHSNQFKCESGKCIPKPFRCDGQYDCPDKSDEASCPANCNSLSFFCDASFKCIEQFKKCDGKNDCPLKEDELYCRGKRCKPNQFRCHTAETECIPKSQVCDYKAQCSDRSDEFKESCQSVNKDFKGEVCHDGYFLCKADGNCLDDYYRCNGDKDCGDGSDELNCSKETSIVTCKPGEIKCEVDGKCIPSEKKCDGHTDCVNGIDEMNCPAKNTSKKALTCAEKKLFDCGVGGKCLMKNKVCDGKNDCPNSADELNCNRVTNCTKDTFSCDGGSSCFPQSKVCDGQLNCLDKTDEMNCTSPTPTVLTPCDATKYFDCDDSGRQCVPWTKVCDSNPDCRFNPGADEKLTKCGEPNVCKKNNGGCAHNCNFDIKLKKKTCSCWKGYKVSDWNPSACVDVDECKTWGTCSYACKNKKGSYDCSCHPGYVPAFDRRRCSAIYEKSLMFTTGTDVREYRFSYSEMRSVVHGLSNAVGFDIDQAKRPRLLYWSNVGGSIVRTNMTSSGMQHEILYSEKNSVPDGLMLDWTNNLLYWTDTGLDRIQVMNLTSGQYHTLLQGREWMDEPRAIVVDPVSGWLYWSDWSNSGAKISMMGMNGVSPTVILDKNDVQYPNALALDPVHRRLYYGDAKLSKIGCIDLTTRVHRDILVGRKIYPFAMTVFEDRIYWSDWIRNAVLAVDKFTGGDPVVVAQSSKPMTLRMIHRYVQPPLASHCQNHHCSHLCLPAPFINSLSYRYSCACPHDMKLNKDGRTCSSKKRHEDDASSKAKLQIQEQHSKQAKHKAPNAAEKETPEVGMIAGVTIGVIITVAVFATILGVFLYGLYSRRAETRTRTMVFDNNSLIKTNEDLYALTRSTSSMIHSRSSSILKHVPTSSQQLWPTQTNEHNAMLHHDPQV